MRSRFLLLTLPLLLLFSPSVSAETLEILSSTEESLSLRLYWDSVQFRDSDEGREVQLESCRLSGESGGPMLPIWSGMIALPPGFRARLTWNASELLPLDGEPLPYPTPRRVDLPDGGELFSEELQRDETLFAIPRAMEVSLGETRWMRDQRVQRLEVRPLRWDPETGLTLARRIEVEIRFERESQSPDIPRESPRREDKLWPELYQSSLLNHEFSETWARRVPASFGRSQRSWSPALLKLYCNDSGLQGLRGEDLLAAGVSLGTPLSEIAIFRRQFTWDEQGLPQWEETPTPRFFQDRNGDGNLDSDDLCVFVGRRLSDQEDGVDSIEWFSREGCYFLSLDPSLALEMNSSSSWQEGGSWTSPDFFERHQANSGESEFFYTPPQYYYIDGPEDRWIDNLYFFNSQTDDTLLLDIPSPGYRSGSEAELQLQFQGYNRQDSYRFFSMELLNESGGFMTLPDMQISGNIDSLYSEILPANALSDGSSQLGIGRIGQGAFFTLVKNWDLSYESDYEVLEDSLFFTSGGVTGNTELRVSGLSRDSSHWILVKTSGEQPLRLELEAINQEGSTGNYSLVFRDVLESQGSWWLCDEESLFPVRMEEASDLSYLDNASSCDVLVISHRDFYETMENRWKPWREAQGYDVTLLLAEQVYDAFHSGSRSDLAIRRAAKYAMQEWGAEALLLVGDSSKDAREKNEFSSPDFIPAHSYHEQVASINEVVALDEWVVKFQFNALPSMIMGRIPADSQEDLDSFLDKLECYETGQGCEGDNSWKSRILLAADDAYSCSDLGCSPTFHYDEQYFRIGQEEAAERVADCVVNDPIWGNPGDLSSLPFYLDSLSHPWYESHPGADLLTVHSDLSPRLRDAFIDTLSHGYLIVSVQSHANRYLLGHESYLNTVDFAHSGDEGYLENYGRPFVWAVLGCHGNQFSVINEESRKDCMGEKMLFLDGMRGSVASYASDGFEFLYPNVALGNDWMEIMCWREDPEGEVDLFPEWRLGILLLTAELRYDSFYSVYRYNLLGDPLTLLDPAPPRIRLFLDGEEMANGESIRIDNLADTLQVSAWLSDETRFSDLRLRDPSIGDLPFQLTALVDSLAAEEGSGARAWALEALILPEMIANDSLALDTLILEAISPHGAIGSFRLPSAKSVFYLGEEGDTLQSGQWVRSSGELEVAIAVPAPSYDPAEFSLFIDGLASEAVFSVSEDDDLVFEARQGYQWSPGFHSLMVKREGKVFGSSASIRLQVDDQPRLLDTLIFPNPFTDVVLFRYELSGGASSGQLTIYSLSGRRVRRIEIQDLGEGVEHWLEWNGLDEEGDRVSNGVYLARMVFEGEDGKKQVWQDKVVRMR
ncbi:MAG: C25 family cysteine peptidase [Candidatus Krumholzibacteria bacterium]|nr:C25 family cysteine peptidase [Candidatus Krumholzibacteria bacterium]